MAFRVRGSGATAFAVGTDLIRHNPLLGLKGVKSEGDGHHAWTEDEIAAFETRHPIATKAGLAMTVMLCARPRRSGAAPLRSVRLQAAS